MIWIALDYCYTDTASAKYLRSLCENKGFLFFGTRKNLHLNDQKIKEYLSFKFTFQILLKYILCKFEHNEYVKIICLDVVRSCLCGNCFYPVFY